MPVTVNDFDVAKAVADQLSGLDKAQQLRVLRWVAESLGLEFRALSGDLKRQDLDPLRNERETNLPLARATDLKTFTDLKQPRSDVQFAAVVAYYYHFEAPPETRKDFIDAETLKNAARLAGYHRPPNPLTTLNNGKTLGYLDSGERGKFCINSLGENLVAMALPASAPEGNKKRAERTKSGKRKRAKKT